MLSHTLGACLQVFLMKMMSLLTFLAGLHCGLAYAAAPATVPATAPAPRYWSVAMADSLIQRNPDFTKNPFRSWGYANGYILCGFEKLYRATGDKKYWDFLRQQVDRYVDAQGALQIPAAAGGTPRPISFTNLDNMMMGNCLIAVYEETHDEKYKTAAGVIRKSLDSYPRNTDGGFWHNASMRGQMWIDGVFMGQMFLTRYGKSIGDNQYAWDEATKQITLFAKHGAKGDSGLFYHAWSEQPQVTAWADKTTGLSPEVWSEGLGWYALILVETLEVLPKDHAQRPAVEDIYRKLAAGLKKVQDPKTGRWFQVVDKGNLPDNWTDNSGSAMFTYSLQKGIELGLIGKAEYAPVVAAGYKGIIDNAKINDQGQVDIYNACQGLGVQNSYAQYINFRKTVNAQESVGGFLWATTIVEKPGK